MNNSLKKEISEVILRNAVRENYNREMATIPSDDELVQLYTLSESHEKRMKQLFIKENRRIIYDRIYYISKRISAAAVFLFLIINIAFLTNVQVRTAIKETGKQWYAKLPFFNNNQDSFFVWHPSYIPEGFSESNRLAADDLSCVEFTNNEGEVIIFDYSKSINITPVVGRRLKDYQMTIINGIEYHTFYSLLNEYTSKIIWRQDDYGFILEANMEIDELLKIAVSVTFKK